MRQTCVLALCLGGCFQLAQAQDTNTAIPPLIESAAATFTTNPGQITIKGTAFGTLPPTVKVDGMVAPVFSHSATMVVCYLPTGITPGSYFLQLTNNSQNPPSHGYF